ncbi:hypothetical protein BGW37DRAFT_477182 [Umbelopsis sp. PMI_123]|nr:hypothetical protein BGW37DRAFT_477182 [Umbelopsis sp. PMI_123]
MSTLLEGDSFDSFPVANQEDMPLYTPSRFLLHCFSESLTPSFGTRYGFEDTNPFEQIFNENVGTREQQVKVDSKGIDLINAGSSTYPSPVSPPTSTSSSDASSSASSSSVERTQPTTNKTKMTVFKSLGYKNFEPGNDAHSSKNKVLKHTLNMENEDLELKRLRFLERNRQAALKCRQKKKQWEKELQTRSEEVVNINKAFRSTVQDLKEEVIMLKNQLLAHSDCDCKAIQEYFANNTVFKFYTPNNYESEIPTSIAMAPPKPLQLQASPNMSQNVAYSHFENTN